MACTGSPAVRSAAALACQPSRNGYCLCHCTHAYVLSSDRAGQVLSAAPSLVMSRLLLLTTKGVPSSATTQRSGAPATVTHSAVPHSMMFSPEAFTFRARTFARSNACTNMNTRTRAQQGTPVHGHGQHNARPDLAAMSTGLRPASTLVQLCQHQLHDGPIKSTAFGQQVQGSSQLLGRQH